MVDKGGRAGGRSKDGKDHCAEPSAQSAARGGADIDFAWGADIQPGPLFVTGESPGACANGSWRLRQVSGPVWTCRRGKPLAGCRDRTAHHRLAAGGGETLKVTISLLDALAVRIGCEYLSDLRFLDGIQQVRLVRALKKIGPEEASLAEWNDALQYLINEPPRQTPEDTKARLIDSLSQPQKAGQKIRK